MNRESRVTEEPVQETSYYKEYLKQIADKRVNTNNTYKFKYAVKNLPRIDKIDTGGEDAWIA